MLQELCFSSFSSTSSSSSSTSLSTLLLFSAGSSLLTVAFPDSMLMKFSLLIVFNTWKSVIEILMLSTVSDKVRFEEAKYLPFLVSWNYPYLLLFPETASSLFQLTLHIFLLFPDCIEQLYNSPGGNGKWWTITNFSGKKWKSPGGDLGQCPFSISLKGVRHTPRRAFSWLLSSWYTCTVQLI